VRVGFGSSPERADELAEVVMAQIDSLRRFGVDGRMREVTATSGPVTATSGPVRPGHC
jgi:hypothetical protein